MQFLYDQFLYIIHNFYVWNTLSEKIFISYSIFSAVTVSLTNYFLTTHKSKCSKKGFKKFLEYFCCTIVELFKLNFDPLHSLKTEELPLLIIFFSNYRWRSVESNYIYHINFKTPNCITVHKETLKIGIIHERRVLIYINMNYRSY